MNYLYNVVELPAMPEHEHKYAYIYHQPAFLMTSEHYVLLFTSEPHYGYTSDGQYDIGHRAGDISYTLYPVTNATEWGHKADWTTQGLQTAVNRVIWANFDVLNEDGSVYLAASDPVPVTTINPSALMQGFFVGMQ